MSERPPGDGWWKATDGNWYPPDQPPGEGWWRASDGNWYPPELAASPPVEPTAPDAPAPAGPATPTAAAPQPTSPTPDAPAPAPTTPPIPPPTSPTPAAPAGPPVAPIPVPTSPTAPAPAPTTPPIPQPTGPTSDAPAGPPVAPIPVPTSPTAPAPAPTTPPIPAPPTSPTPAAASGTRRRRKPLVAVAVVAVAALVVGVVVLTRGGDGPGRVSADTLLTSGPDVLPDESLDLQPEVVVVRGDDGATLRAIRDDGATLVLDPSASGASDLAPGDVLLLTGLTVVKVEGVEQQGDDLVVSAGPANLVDVLSDGELEWDDVVVDPAGARVILGEPELLDGDGDAWGGTGGLAEGDHAGAVLLPRPGQAMSGRVADFDFTIDYGPRGGGGHRLDLTLAGTGNLKGDIAVEVLLDELRHSGFARVEQGEARNFDWELSDLSGQADIAVNLQSIEQLTSVNTPRFLRVPFSIEWVMPVGGIPFKFSLGATIEVRLSFSMTNSSLQGRATVSFGGDAGMEWTDGELSVAGRRVTDIADTFSALAGAASGPVGVVFTVEAPKMTFGLGIAQTGVGVFVSSGLVTSQFLAGSTSAIPCMAVATAYVLAAGVDAQFLGYSWDLVRKPIVDERWERYAPQHPACAP